MDFSSKEELARIWPQLEALLNAGNKEESKQE